MWRKLASATKPVNSFFSYGSVSALGFAAAFVLQSGAAQNVGIVFTDIANRAGITFVHDNTATAQKYLIETMGAGCGWIDFDQDGLLDLYLANSAPTAAYKPRSPLRGALYRNKGDGTFSAVTDRAGVGASGLFGMGVAAGDYDSDGFPDLLVLGYGRSILYHNNGDGTFSDVTAKAGVENRGRWASSAAWFDYDKDGKLDLVIANYVDWTPENNFYCGDRGPGMRSYCHPDVYHGQPATLFHGNGDGTFTDVSSSSGVGIQPANGLGVVTFDYDDDGWQDIFIANDGMPNHLFHNQGNSTFREVAYKFGVAVSADGQAEAGMGVDAGDTTGTGRPDLFVTHLDLQLGRLYRNLGAVRNEGFDDYTLVSGIGYDTYNLSGFGTRFLDYDNDGARDLFVANGHVLDNIERYRTNTRYREPKLMFRNKGRGTFENISLRLGPDLQASRVSRAAAAGDFDNDGDIDILISNNGERPQLLRNDGGNANHWLEILLVGTKSNRDAIGARIKVTAGDLVPYDERKGGMSYQSSQDPRLHFGLGKHAQIDEVEVKWPSGMVTKLGKLQADQIIELKEGTGLTDRRFPHMAR